MGAVSDLFGRLQEGFVPATLFPALLFAGMFYNCIFNPSREVILHSDQSEYGLMESAAEGD